MSHHLMATMIFAGSAGNQCGIPPVHELRESFGFGRSFLLYKLAH